VSVVLLAPDGIIIAAHGTGGAGSPGAEAVGHPIWEALWPAPRRGERARLQGDVGRAAGGATVDTRVPAPAGAPNVAATMIVRLAPLRDATGGVRFILGSIADPGTSTSPAPPLPDALASRLVHRINNSVNGVKAALAVLRQAVPADAQDVRLLQLVDRELDLLAGVALEVAETDAPDA
jgi:hypothetical protein